MRSSSTGSRAAAMSCASYPRRHVPTTRRARRSRWSRSAWSTSTATTRTARAKRSITSPRCSPRNDVTIRIAAETPWYDLFSRGARDWLRHNEKVREAVKANLPDLLAGEDLMTQSATKTAPVPGGFLEQARPRLGDGESQKAAGQAPGGPA